MREGRERKKNRKAAYISIRVYTSIVSVLSAGSRDPSSKVAAAAFRCRRNAKKARVLCDVGGSLNELRSGRNRTGVPHHREFLSPIFTPSHHGAIRISGLSELVIASFPSSRPIDVYYPGARGTLTRLSISYIRRSFCKLAQSGSMHLTFHAPIDQSIKLLCGALLTETRLKTVTPHSA